MQARSILECANMDSSSTAPPSELHQFLLKGILLLVLHFYNLYQNILVCSAFAWDNPQMDCYSCTNIVAGPYVMSRGLYFHSMS